MSQHTVRSAVNALKHLLNSTAHCSTHNPLQGGWTGVLASARYGHADVLRELITEYGCDKNATKRVRQHALSQCVKLRCLWGCHP